MGRDAVEIPGVMTGAEFQALAAKRRDRRDGQQGGGLGGERKHKYNATPTWFHGVRYHSKLEAERAGVLLLLVRAGQISDLQRQVVFELGCPENRCIMDFVYRQDGRWRAEDVKGFETAAFKKIRRLWERYGPCELRVVTRHTDHWEVECVAGGCEHANDDSDGHQRPPPQGKPVL